MAKNYGCENIQIQTSFKLKNIAKNKTSIDKDVRKIMETYGFFEQKFRKIDYL